MTLQKDLLSGVSLSVVGPGRVGSSLASWVVSCGGELRQVAARQPESARRLTMKLGGHATALHSLESLAEDILLIAVSDSALGAVSDELANRRQANVALHTSGRHTAESLSALRPGGTAIGSIHPLMAFPEILDSPQVASGMVFGMDGDSSAKSLTRRLVDAWSGTCAEIPGATRELYHLGATLAAGGVVTLLASAARLSQSLGLDPSVVEGYLKLSRGALEQAAQSRPIAAAITGPVARGDLEGFAGQIAKLREQDTQLADLVEMIAKRTIFERRECVDNV